VSAVEHRSVRTWTQAPPPPSPPPPPPSTPRLVDEQRGVGNPSVRDEHGVGTVLVDCLLGMQSTVTPIALLLTPLVESRMRSSAVLSVCVCVCSRGVPRCLIYQLHRAVVGDSSKHRTSFSSRWIYNEFSDGWLAVGNARLDCKQMT